MKIEQMRALASLREEGYAVIVFTPEELEGVKPHKLEDRLIELGWDVIQDFSPITELPTPIEKWQQQRDAGIPFPDINGQ